MLGKSSQKVLREFDEVVDECAWVLDTQCIHDSSGDLHLSGFIILGHRLSS